MSDDMFVVVKSRENDTLESVLVKEKSVSDLYKKVMTSIDNSTYDLESELTFIKMYIMQSICISNFFAASNYNNLLVVPSFKNSRYTTLFDESNQHVRDHIITNLWPCISEHFGQSPNVYYAFPTDHSSFCRDLARDFNVSRVVCNKPYVVGDDTFSVENADIQFDAVLLAGQPIEEGTTFAAADIKSDFASICTEDFDLIEMCSPNGISQSEMRTLIVQDELAPHELPPRPTVFTGQEKDTREICEYINSTIKIENDADNFHSTIIPKLSYILQREIKVY